LITAIAKAMQVGKPHSPQLVCGRIFTMSNIEYAIFYRPFG
jgi:hypothetical protein